MPARTGEQYVEGLRRARTVYEIGGERLVGGAAEHPALRNVVQTYATLFDLQHDLDLRDTMTYSSPLTGEQVSTSFLQPESRDDLVRRREMMTVWAEHSRGMLGRTGDYLNSGVHRPWPRPPASSPRRIPGSAGTSSAPTSTSASTTSC